MPTSDELFLIISALRPSEKRYISIHLHLHTGSRYKLHYEKLFDALSAWKGAEYTDTLLRKKHRGKIFLKDLPTNKKRLREFVLKIMRTYNTGRDKHIVLSEMLIDIRFLIAKGLSEQAYRLIKEALAIAEAEQMFSEKLILNDQLLQLYPISPDKAPYTALQVKQAEKDAIQQMDLTRRAVHLKVRLLEIESNGQWHKRKKKQQN